MTRQNQWGRNELSRIRAILGNRCAKCGNTSDLELDCIEPRGHKHHAMGRCARACFYRREMRAGNVQLLCNACHAIKTASE